MTGGNGPDVFFYDSVDDGYAVATNPTLPIVISPDVITDFQSGVDVLQILASAFGITEEEITLGDNFSVINGPYDGTDAGDNENFENN